MQTVHVLTTKTTHNSLAFNLPLRLHQKRLRNLGIDLTLHFEFDDAFLDAHTLFINSKYFRQGFTHAEVVEHLQKANRYANNVLWFDTTDSTGATQFHTLPYIDGYYKSHILKNKQLYLKEFHGARIYTDYYYQQYGISDSDESFQTVLPNPADLHKIHISWNAAFGDYGQHANLATFLHKWVKLPHRYTATFTQPAKERKVSIACRISKNHKRETIQYHRNKIAKILENQFQIQTNYIAPQEYHKELQNARIGISPFGWGEFAYRDYEIMLHGAALVKPDLSHMQTWPNLYIDKQTYLAHNWDLSDLSDVLHRALTSSTTQTIAQNAQMLYKKYLLQKDGHSEFCQRVYDIVMKHS